MSDLKIGFAEDNGDVVMVVTGMRVGHAPALASALHDFVMADRARFNNGGLSGVGMAAEDFLNALNKAHGF